MEQPERREMFENIQPQQAFDGARSWEIMAGYFDIFECDTKSLESWHKNSGYVFNTASSRDFYFPMRPQRITSNGDSGFDRYHGESGSGIQSQFQGKFHPATFKRDVTGNDAFCGAELKLSHPLVSRCEAFGKGILGILKKNFFSLSI